MDMLVKKMPAFYYKAIVDHKMSVVSRWCTGVGVHIGEWDRR